MCKCSKNVRNDIQLRQIKAANIKNENYFSCRVEVGQIKINSQHNISE